MNLRQYRQGNKLNGVRPVGEDGEILAASNPVNTTEEARCSEEERDGENSAKIAPSQWPNYRITATILQYELTRAELNGVSLTRFTEFQMLECIVSCILLT